MKIIYMMLYIIILIGVSMSLEILVDEMINGKKVQDGRGVL